jgi:hypothetical protein
MKQHRIDRLLEARSLEPGGGDLGVGAPRVDGCLRVRAQRAAPPRRCCARQATACGAVGGHHHLTFYAVRTLGDPALEAIADAMQNLRGGRHTALYGDEEELEAEDLEHARNDVSQLLRAIHGWLIIRRPSLTGRLPAPPGP